MNPAFAILISALLLFATACHKSSDIDQINAAIGAMAAAAQQGKFADLGKYLHNDFRANDEMNAEQVRQMLTMLGMQHQAMTVTVVSTQTHIDPVYQDKAESNVSVISTSGTSFAGLPSNGTARVVKLEWRKDGDWKVLRAHWQE